MLRLSAKRYYKKKNRGKKNFPTEKVAAAESMAVCNRLFRVMRYVLQMHFIYAIGTLYCRTYIGSMVYLPTLKYQIIIHGWLFILFL